MRSSWSLEGPGHSGTPLPPVTQARCWVGIVRGRTTLSGLDCHGDPHNTDPLPSGFTMLACILLQANPIKLSQVIFEPGGLFSVRADDDAFFFLTHTKIGVWLHILLERYVPQKSV